MYNSSQVMFRRAQACAADAARHADRAATEIRSGLSGAEPRQRERDSVIETVILSQAAAESYVNWIYLQAGISAQEYILDRPLGRAASRRHPSPPRRLQPAV